MVDRVKLAVLDQVFHVRRFDTRDSGLLQQRANTCDEPVGVSHVGENVVRDNDVRPLAFGREACGPDRA